MKKLNLLNRCMILIYSCMALVLRICGISSFYYNRSYKIFISSEYMRFYVIILTSINAVILMAIFLLLSLSTYNRRAVYDKEYLRLILKLTISFFTRFHQSTYEDDFIELLNELYQIYQDIRVLSRHPNIFRLTHFVLCAVALQSMIRSTVINLSIMEHVSIAHEIFIIWFNITAVITFNLLVAAVMLIFISLIACYDELHRCTKRISNDVRTLRLSQQMEGGQRLVLVRQLGGILSQLIAVRGRMFNFTGRFIKFFRLHLVLSILYWIGHEVMIFLSHYNESEKLVFWEILVGLLNVAFYCSIFEILKWQSKLSRSFWNFHLTNYDADFDRTVDQLLHCELVENVKVSAYGIQLNLRLFCKVLLLTVAYFMMRYRYQKI